MGGGTPKNTTQTTTAEPPAYLRSYLEQGASEAANNYAAGPNEYYSGETVVPMSEQTQQALDLTQQRALAGSPVTGAAQDYATKALSTPITSEFGATQNPYLDETFNQAADTVQNRLASTFAGSGRNIGASRAPMAGELNDLATSIYGGAYDADQNRKLTDITSQRSNNLGLTGLSPSLANQDYVDYGQLGQVGAQYEDLTGRQMEDSAARWDFGQNADDLALDNYLQRIGMINGGAGGTTSATTPIYRNRTAGAVGGGLSGAATGATIGSAVPGIGTAVGAGVGGLIGLLGGYL